jgi:aminoglycoside phosphotransferase (APT) family kinase protein
VPGTPVDQAPLDPGEAARFGRFLADLHGPPPPDAPRNPYRGVPLRAKHDLLVPRWERLAAQGFEVDVVRAAWDEVADVPVDVPTSWLHADLHPKNVIGERGRLAGVIDWGDLCVGDPANDLAAAWMLFPPDVHDRIWAEWGGLTDATLDRARGWAIFFGTVLLDTGAGDTFGPIGRQTLARVLGVSDRRRERATRWPGRPAG